MTADIERRLRDFDPAAERNAKLIAAGYEKMTLIQFLQMVRRYLERGTKEVERVQPPKQQTRYTYTEGPMLFLGQQIVARMKKTGYDAKILYLYRSPEHQNRLYAKGRTTPGKRVTNARAWQSPHQYHEAVDIIHATKGWPPKDDPFWKALDNCAKVVQEEYRVLFKLGSDWGDHAHIELLDWRNTRDACGKRRPTDQELAERFQELLPSIWKRYTSK